MISRKNAFMLLMIFIIMIMALSTDAIADTQKGKVFSWGANYYGQLGNGGCEGRLIEPPDIIENLHPQPIPDLYGIIAIDVYEHAVAARADGTVWTWGRNNYGQLGTNITYNDCNNQANFANASPAQVQGIGNITAVAVGWNHSVALDKDGTVWAWGKNNYGQLGIGTSDTNIHATPTKVKSISNISAIEACGDTTVAVRRDGNILVWGNNQYGQLGRNTADSNPHPSPTSVYYNGTSTDLTNVVAVACGYNHILALKGDGTVWAWGNNDSGQLGDNTTTAKYGAIQVGSLSGITAIDAGFNYSIALKGNDTASASTLWAWGSNSSGQFGDCTTTSSLVPKDISYGTSGIRGISVSSSSTYVLNFSPGTCDTSCYDTRLSAGANNWGQLGRTYSVTCFQDITLKPEMGYIVGLSAGGMSVMGQKSQWITSNPASNYNVGKYSSIAVDSNNKAHISYYDETYGNLNYLTNVSGSWQETVVDSGGNVGKYSSIALDGNGKAHISYYDATNSALKYANNVSGWSTTIFPTSNINTTYSSTSIAVNKSTGSVHIAYTDTGLYLRHATNITGSWVISAQSAIDGPAYTQYLSLALDSSGRVHIAYYDDGSGGAIKDLKYVYGTYSGGTWTWSSPAVIDSTGDVGQYPSIAIDPADRVHISYYDATYTALKYATNAPSGTWSVLPLAGYDSGDIYNYFGKYSSIAVDSNSRPHISYYNEFMGTLVYATRNSSGSWVTNAIVDSLDLGDIGQYSSIAISSGNRVHISYYDATNMDLKYAIKGDFDKPTGTVSINSGATYTNLPSVNLSVTCDDGNGYGCTQTQFSNIANVPFESGLPSGWTVVDNAGTGAVWRFDNPGSHSNLTGGTGNFAIADSDYALYVDMDTELRTPVMDLSTIEEVILEFKTDYYNWTTENADVDVSINGASGPWTTVWSKEGVDYRGPKTETINISSIAAGQSNVMIRFHYYDANYEYWWQIDEVKISGGLAYPATAIWNLIDPAFGGVNSDGTKTVYAQFVDGTGNWSMPVSDTIFLDRVDPSGTLSINSGNNYDGTLYTNMQFVLLGTSCTDPSPSSGCAQMQFSTNFGSSWSSPDVFGAFYALFLPSGDGTKTVWARYIDGAGNDSVVNPDTEKSLVLDQTQPSSGSVTINSGASTTNNPSVTLSLQCSDATSGCRKLQLSNDNSTWSGERDFLSSPQTESWTLSSGDGVKTVYVRFYDAAGNWNSYDITDQITLDTTTPTGSILINNNADYTNNSSVTLALACSDNGTGCDKMKFSNDYIHWTTAENIASEKTGYTLIDGPAKAWTWGDNSFSQLGKGTTGGSTNTPGQITSESHWLMIDSGSYHTLAIKPDGTLWVWGRNQYCQLGLGASVSCNDSTGYRNLPTQVGTDSDWAWVSAGGSHSIAIKKDGSLWAWGYNNYGQLGNGVTGGTYNTPQPIASGTKWASVVSGNSHSLGIRSDGTLWSWGYNVWGQLGLGTSGSPTNDKNTPQQVGSGNNWAKVSADYSHSMGIKTDGTLWTWGQNAYGQLGCGGTCASTNSPQQIGSDTWTEIAAGRYHSLGIKSNGSLWAWGYNSEGQLGNGNTGTNQNTPQPIAAGNTWSSVAAGSYFSFAIKSDSSLYAWGDNLNGQLGNGNTGTDQNTPQPISAGSRWTSVSAGYYFSAAISVSDTKYVFVKYKDGIGNWSPAYYDTIVLDQEVPTGSLTILNSDPTTSGTADLQLSCNDNISGCATMEFSTNGGTVWSSPVSYEQISSLTLPSGDGLKEIRVRFTDRAGNQSVSDANTIKTITVDQNAPTSINITINSGATATSSASVTLTLECTDPTTGCAEYQLKNESGVWSSYATMTASPLDVPWTLTSVDGTKTVSARFKDGAGNETAVDSDDILLDGTNPAGTISINSSAGYTDLNTVQLDLLCTDSGTGCSQMTFSNNGTTWTTPENYATPKTDYQIGASPATPWSWGINDNGELGIGTSGAGTEEYAPQEVTEENIWTAISSGANHTLTLRTDGTVWAWGENSSCQLGDGPDCGTDSSVPVQVEQYDGYEYGMLTDVTFVAAGGNHSLAVKNDGSLWAWGSNTYGQFGCGTTCGDTRYAQKIGTDQWIAVAAGGDFSLGIKTDGTLWAWGYNYFGQLGLGHTNDRNTPQQVSPGTTWIAVTAGSNHVLAIRSDGSLRSWGDNYIGQLGIGTSGMDNFETLPVLVSSDSWSVIAAGDSHSLAIKSDGTLWSWGWNSRGQLGLGNTTNYNSPQQVGTATWKTVAAGREHSLGIKTNDTLSGWGDNTYGQLGIGLGFTQRTAPEPILSEGGSSIYWNNVSAGDQFSTGILTAGEQTVYVKYKDGIGNWSLPISDTIVLDPIDPVGSVTINGGDSYTVSTSVNLTISCNDRFSGCYQMCISNDDPSGTPCTTWETYKTTKTGWLLEGSWSNTVYVCFKDYAANSLCGSVAASDSIYLDTQKPTGTLSITPGYTSGSKYTKNANVDLVLSADGNGSPEASMRFSNDDSIWSSEYAYSTSFTGWPLAAGGDGSRTVYVQYKDAAGWWSDTEISDTIVLDTTAPSGTVSINSGAIGTNSLTVSLDLTCSDGSGSGCAKVQISNDGVFDTEPEENIVSPRTNWNLTAGAEGTRTVYVRFKDNLGTWSGTFGDTISYDTGNPTVSITSPSNGTNYNTNGPSTISGTAADSYTGIQDVKIQIKRLFCSVTTTNSCKIDDDCPGSETCTGFEYRQSGGTWGPSADWFTASGTTSWSIDTSGWSWKPDSNYSLTARATDNAANQTDSTSVMFYYLGGAPIMTTLTETLSSLSILQNATIDASGQLTKNVTGFPPAGTGLEIKLTITKPDASTVILTQNTNSLGQYSFTGLNYFNLKGTYTLKAEFEGNGVLDPSSVQKTLLVGSSAGYAIIVQGRIKSEEGLNSHSKTAQNIYKALKERGFIDEHINYLDYSYGTPGQKPGVDATPSKTAIQQAITVWAKDWMNGVPAPLYIIKVDHGNRGIFYVDDGDANPGEAEDKITPEDLDGWLDTLETSLESTRPEALLEKRIVIIGACYSGGFMSLSEAPQYSGETLIDAGRLIITSATENEESYKGMTDPEDGIRSGEYFLDEFFIELEKGSTLKEAFKESVRHTAQYTRHGSGSSNSSGLFGDNAEQHPLLDDNGDGVGTNKLSDGTGDGIYAEEMRLGVGPTNAATSTAEFVSVKPTDSLSAGATTVLLYGNATIDGDVDSAWLEVRPPSKVLNPSGGTGQLERGLTPSSMTWSGTNSRYEKNYTIPAESGMYEVFYYTKEKVTLIVTATKRSIFYVDSASNTSAPTAPTLLTPSDGATNVKTELLLEWDPGCVLTTYTDQGNCTSNGGTWFANWGICALPSYLDKTTCETNSGTWQRSWDANGDVVTYSVFIAPDATTCDLVDENAVYKAEELGSPATYVASDAGLADNTDYKWKVRAMDSYGKFTDSPCRTFHTDNTNSGILCNLKGNITNGTSGPGINGATIYIKQGGSVVGTTYSFDGLSMGTGFYITSFTSGTTTIEVRNATGFQDENIIDYEAPTGPATLNIAMTANDTTKPTVSISSGPADPTNQTSASFEFSGSDDTGVTGYICSLDSGGYIDCTSPKSYSSLSSGSHTFSVKSRDAAMNESNADTWSWTLDLSEPDTAITAGPSSPTKQSTADFTVTSTLTGSTFECELDGGGTSFGACPNIVVNGSGNQATIQYTGLSAIAHILRVRAKGPTLVVDSTPASYSWTVDQTAPSAPAITSPASGTVTNSTVVLVAGTAEADSTVAVQEGTTTLCSATATGGNWSCTTSTLSHGTHSITAKATDTAGNTGSSSTAISVSINNKPVANAQSVSTNEDTAKAITLTSSDADSDSRTYSIVTNPAHGSLSGTPPSVTYTPSANYNGSDSFTFRVNDGYENSDSATVSITVSVVNDAPTISNVANQSTNEDTSKDNVAFTINDVDSTLTCTGSVSKGSSNTTLLPVANITIAGTAPNCTVSMTPAADQYGTSTVTLTVSDGSLSAQDTFVLTVSAVNDTPTISDISDQSTNEDTPKNSVAFTISDVESTLTCTGSVSKGSSNTTLLPVANITIAGTAPNCTVSMTPAADQYGTSTVTLTVSDGSLSAQDTFVLTVSAVNDAPVANAQSVTTNEDTAKAITLTGTDVEGSALTYTIVSGPSKGSLSGTPPSVTYTPDANSNGSDSFTFKVNDGSVDSTSATVSITVTAVNDAPVANNGTLTTIQNTQKSGTLSATDIESSPLTYSIVANGSKGTAVITNSSTGAYTYTPNTDEIGFDSFTFKANDGATDSNTATISVTIGGTPSVVTVSNRQLLVGGEAFTVKGVVYSPVPVGEDPGTTPPYGDYFTIDQAAIYDRDLDSNVAGYGWIRRMKANTIRVLQWDSYADHTDFLDVAYNNGVDPVYVIPTFWINPGLDISNASVRADLADDFADMVALHKNHPAILMWSIGEDLNDPSMYGGDQANLFLLLDELAAVAHTEDTNHPVTTALTDYYMISTITAYEAAGHSDTIDIWGAKVYRGWSFGTLFSSYKTKSTRPLLIMGYGIDAYDSDTGDEDEYWQAVYADYLWRDIQNNSSDNSGVCIGGTYSDYSDQWWTGRLSTDSLCTSADPESLDPALQGVCGYETFAQPDGYSNEEWYGIMRINGVDAINPLIDNLEPRQVYYTLLNKFGPLSVNLTANKTASQPAGTTITFTGSATGGSELYEYQFQLWSPTTGTYVEQQSYGVGDTWNWTPAQGGTYYIKVFARNQGSFAAYEGYKAVSFTITGELTLTSSKSSPQTAGTAMTFTATSTGYTSPEYRFLLWSSMTGTFTEMQGYGVGDTWNWTPTLGGTYYIQVQVRNQGSIAAYDEVKTCSFMISGGLTLTSSKSSPQAAGTAITFTAASSGYTNPQYRFLLWSPYTENYSEVQAYSSDNTWDNWTPTQTGIYYIQVQVRNEGSITTYDDAKTGSFMISGGLTLTSSKSSPQAAGTAMTFTAGSTGYTDPQYRFLLQSPSTGTYSEVQAYSSDNTWDNWIPALGGIYYIQVQVRNQGSIAAYDEVKTCSFMISGGLTLTSSKSSPQAAGTAMTFTAASTGYTDPQYRFLLWSPYTGTYSEVQAYSSDNTWDNWTPTQTGIYYIQVQVRNEDSLAAYDENKTVSFGVQ